MKILNIYGPLLGSDSDLMSRSCRQLLPNISESKFQDKPLQTFGWACPSYEIKPIKPLFLLLIPSFSSFTVNTQQRGSKGREGAWTLFCLLFVFCWLSFSLHSFSPAFPKTTAMYNTHAHQSTIKCNFTFVFSLVYLSVQNYNHQKKAFFFSSVTMWELIIVWTVHLKLVSVSTKGKKAFLSKKFPSAFCDPLRLQISGFPLCIFPLGP